MKNLIKSTLLLAVSVFVFSCESGPESPEKVAEQFLNAVNNKDFEKAKALSTPESHQMIEIISNFSEQAPDAEKVEKIIKISECKVDGTNAECIYCCDAEGKETSIKLKQIEGAWKADLSKEALFGKDSPLENIDLGEGDMNEEWIEDDTTVAEEMEVEVIDESGE